MESLLAWLVEPFQYGFMLRALAGSLMVGVVVPVLGTFVVLRGMAFFGDALAHIILPGVVLAFLFGWPLAAGALATGIIAALAIGWLEQEVAIREDTAIGVVLAGALALGVALLSARRDYAVDLTHILFGNLLGTGPDDLLWMAILSAIVVIIVYLLFKEFLVISFDLTLAHTLQLPVAALSNLLLVLLAAVIVISLQAVGVALVLAALVTPAAAAQLLTHRVPGMIGVASAIGGGSALAGLYVSYYLDIPSGPAIVLVMTLVFAVVFLNSPRRRSARRERGRSQSRTGG